MSASLSPRASGATPDRRPDIEGREHAHEELLNTLIRQIEDSARIVVDRGGAEVLRRRLAPMLDFLPTATAPPLPIATPPVGKPDPLDMTFVWRALGLAMRRLRLSQDEHKLFNRAVEIVGALMQVPKSSPRASGVPNEKTATPAKPARDDVSDGREFT